jgi:mono/diheme cytochrome c family protein
MPFALLKRRAMRPAVAVAALMLALGAALINRLDAANDDANYPAASLTAPTDPAALIARGKYVTDAADCMPCHTGPNHAPFSGGLVLNTPFGGLASPNITPDKATGIGNWTDKQFYDALHHGISPGRSYLVFPKYLYPAMPFTSYTKLSYADVLAIKAYLFSLAPVTVAPTPNSMGFPFNQRPTMLGWRILFFRAGPMHMDPAWDDHTKNGAYLTEALGHCAECHTPRNILGAMKNGRWLAGAPIDAFYAPNITSDKTYGVGGWNQADLVSYLHDDGNMVKGSPYGPMDEVVKYSLSRLPAQDVTDIANYLQTATKPLQTPPSPAVPGAADSVARGAKVYAANCAACHGQTGGGMNMMIPNLAGNSSVTAAEPFNTIGAVLNGLPPWKTVAMPSFAASLSDQQIADVTNYVRTAFGNEGTANATLAQVMDLRGIATVPPWADKQADQLGCPRITSNGAAGTVADPGGNLLSIYQGVTPETMPNRTRALIATVRGNNSSISDADLTDTLAAAYCPVVAHTPGMSLSAKRAALKSFIENIGPTVASH